MMRLSSFKFTLPPKLIASRPAETRDEARLMVIHKSTGQMEHKQFKDILDYFHPEDTLVLNDTRVFPAQLSGIKEHQGAEIKVFLLRELDQERNLWDTLVDPARKIRVGNKLYFGNGELVAEVLDNTTSRGRTLRFLFDGRPTELYDTINRLGTMPLPPELKRKARAEDRTDYQTVYAKHVGSVIAPAAGLHFTPHLLKRLALKGVHTANITLHISLDMLKAIDVEDLSKYRMGSEPFHIPEEATQIVNTSLDHGKHVCAVGVSTAKSLESSVSVAGRLKPAQGWTNRFILPPYQCRLCTALITNWHLPESAPLIAAAAFGGYDLIMEAYQVAIKEKYRFFVYGDAMLILP